MKITAIVTLLSICVVWGQDPFDQIDLALESPWSLQDYDPGVFEVVTDNQGPATSTELNKEPKHKIKDPARPQETNKNTEKPKIDTAQRVMDAAEKIRHGAQAAESFSSAVIAAITCGISVFCAIIGLAFKIGMAMRHLRRQGEGMGDCWLDFLTAAFKRHAAPPPYAVNV